MKRIVLIFFIVVFSLCHVRAAPHVSMNKISQQESEVCVTAAEMKTTRAAADVESLESLLDGLLLFQPCSAGNSLRMAALGGELYKWYIENPQAGEAAKQAALAWGSKRCPEERHQAAVNVRMLGKAAERMREVELSALLYDAGITLPGDSRDKEGFVYLTEAISKVLWPEIFKKHAEIMNNSR